MKNLRQIMLTTAFILTGFVVNAQDYKYHPSFIYNFTKYIEWPASYQTGDFVIAVLGDSEIIIELEKMAENKSVGSQKFVIKKLKSADEIEKCHLLFIPVSKSKELTQALLKLEGKPTLIVTEKPGMASQGSGINFVMMDGKWKFELNKSATEKSNLKVSSDLAKFAIII
ncbi:MAG: YfiR family protein [Bacteroidota bacterium]|nr:YfiR family protein [Bacteroidota bacterium]